MTRGAAVAVAAPDGLGDEIASVAAWRVAAGDRVRARKPVCDLVAGKLACALDAPADGVIGDLIEIGAAVRAGDVLARIWPDADAARKKMRKAEKKRGAGKHGPAKHGKKRRKSVEPDDDGEVPAAAFLPDDELDGLEGDAEPLGAMRLKVAQRMALSKLTAPCFYLTVAVDMTRCLALRENLRAENRRATYNDMIVKASALTLREFPRVASVYTPAGYRSRAGVHVGVAVDIEPDGLAVPVVRDADQKPLTRIAAEIRDLARRARSGRLWPADCAEGCFSVSNLGGFDVDEFIAIVNPGESAILAVGRIHDAPVAVDGRLDVRPLARLTLSADHRTVDGALAARFMQSLKARLECPEPLAEA